MTGENRYDVTAWPAGDPYDDIGWVINDMIADLKRHQARSSDGDRGRPGAVIHIPPGDYRLRTQIVIDVSFLRIQGNGHGFTSSSIRFNLPESRWPDLHELWPGGSRILVDRSSRDGDPSSAAAFRVARSGDPRISSVEFADFCIDGGRFEDDGSGLPAANTYVNGKTGIHVVDANDSFRVTGMGFVYLETALSVHGADALSIHDNFIAECGSCIELVGWGQATKVTDNLIGAGFRGHSIYAENHGGLLVTANNVFPRGASSVRLRSVTRSSVTANRFHSFYPGMVVLEEDSSENLVGSNHFLRDEEPWTPFSGVDNGLDDDYGLVRVSGDDNSIIGNHFSEAVDARNLRPVGTRPVIIRLRAGSGNYVASNHAVGRAVGATPGQSAHVAQVEALLRRDGRRGLALTTVLVDPESSRNIVLDYGTVDEIAADTYRNVVRHTPSIEAPSPRSDEIDRNGQ